MHHPSSTSSSSLGIAPLSVVSQLPEKAAAAAAAVVVVVAASCAPNRCKFRAQRRAVPVCGGGEKTKLGCRGGIQCGDGGASAPVETGDAWENRYPNEDIRLLAKFQSSYNFVQVLEVSRRADHALAGCRVLLLDRPGNIQSVYNPYNVITDSYYDVFATLPPLLPEGPVGILGLGAGTAARLLLHFWPHVELHGWELDPSVLMVARKFFDLEELEQGKIPGRRDSAFAVERDTTRTPGASSNDRLNDVGRLVVHVGDGLHCEAPTEEGFAGLIVDMFSGGAVIPALQQPQTWQRLRKLLKPGGRVMVNCGGSCVQADSRSAARPDGETTMEETLGALLQVFPGEISRYKLPGKGDNSMALSGPAPDFLAWEKALPPGVEARLV